MNISVLHDGLTILLIVLAIATSVCRAGSFDQGSLACLGMGSLLAAAWQRRIPRRKRVSSVRNRSRRLLASARRRWKTG